MDVLVRKGHPPVEAMHRSEYRYRSSERLTSPIRPEREERDSKGKETAGFVLFGLQLKMLHNQHSISTAEPGNPTLNKSEHSTPSDLYFSCILQVVRNLEETLQSILNGSKRPSALVLAALDLADRFLADGQPVGTPSTATTTTTLANPSPIAH